mgnify:FL=1
MNHPCAELVARCFAARTAAHFAHLITGSYAQHMALGDFYDAVASGADEFVECYQGIFGKLTGFPDIRPSQGDITAALSDLRTWIAANREECCEAYDDNEDGENAGDRDDVDNTELANLIDNILAVVDRTLYKLKFLK